MRPWFSSALALTAVLTAIALPTSVRSESESQLSKLGLSVASKDGITLNYAKKNKEMVGLGSFLVNSVGDCDGCHSTNEWAAGNNPYQGQIKKIDTAKYLAGGQAFGPFTSANLTPDNTGKPGGMTYSQFVAAIRTGADPMVPGRTLQVMPWPAFQDMTDHQLQAIYAYLSAVPSLPDGGN